MKCAMFQASIHQISVWSTCHIYTEKLRQDKRVIGSQRRCLACCHKFDLIYHGSRLNDMIWVTVTLPLVHFSILHLQVGLLASSTHLSIMLEAQIDRWYSHCYSYHLDLLCAPPIHSSEALYKVKYKLNSTTNRWHGYESCKFTV